jgi:hypothetical protein
VHHVEIAKHFDQTFRIVSHPKFLSRSGLGNEVPFFIDTYEPADEFAVQEQIRTLCDRLDGAGIVMARLPVYDVVLDTLTEAGRLEAIFEYEKQAPKSGAKRTFGGEMEKLADPADGKRLQLEIRRRMEAVPEARLALMYQLGTVYPFLRTHTLLNNLHSVITTVPLVAFFPGEYVSSDRDGFYLSLFGKFKGDYYRAFRLSEYIERGQIRADVE